MGMPRTPPRGAQTPAPPDAPPPPPATPPPTPRPPAGAAAPPHPPRARVRRETPGGGEGLDRRRDRGQGLRREVEDAHAAPEGGHRQGRSEARRPGRRPGGGRAGRARA